MPYTTREPLHPVHPSSADRLLCIGDIRAFFKLGRTAAYELTHRPDFPAPVIVSTRCYRWWASEVTAFATSMRRQNARPRRHGNASHARRQATLSNGQACRISGRVRTARIRKPA